MIVLLVLLLALLLDVGVGELSNRLHPVAGMGRMLGLGTRWFPRRGDKAQFIYGALVVLATVVVFAGATHFLLLYLGKVSTTLYVLGAAAALKCSFSLRGLWMAARRVRVLLAADDIERTRVALGALVSRDTRRLDNTGIIGATVESVAENTSDSFVAPMFYFLILGVPGAVAYRVVNTADAMIGYHGKWEYLGKFAARLDDVLNYIPARLTALLLVFVSQLSLGTGRESWRILRRDHVKTESPNAGWPMSAMAGSLGVRLEKEGLYQLGDPVNALEVSSIDTSVRLMALAATAWAAVTVAAKGMILAVAR